MWLDFRELSFNMEGMATEPAIGTKIKRARERKRLTQRKLAEQLGVTQKTIDNWEHGRTKPNSAIGALEDVLGIRLDGEPEPEPAIPERLRQEIINTPGLTPGQRQAVIAAVEETLARERGEAAAEAWAPPAEPRERGQQASLSAPPYPGRRLSFSDRRPSTPGWPSTVPR